MEALKQKTQGLQGVSKNTIITPAIYSTIKNLHISISNRQPHERRRSLAGYLNMIHKTKYRLQSNSKHF